MRRTWFWIGIIIILLLGVLGYLYHKGLIHTSWQWLTIILAAAAAPFKLLTSIFTDPKKQIEKIQKQQQARIAGEQQHRITYDQVIIEKEKRIRELEAKVNQLEDQIDQYELQKQSTKQEIMTTNDVETLSDEFMQAYGDES